MHWLPEKLKRPSDFVAGATLSLSPIIPPTMCLTALFLSLSFDVSRDLSVCYIILAGALVRIARLEPCCVERGGDLIGVTRRGEPLQLWMNF